jgi:spore coat polysaccharide biosynthesis predicted glycosyltransferase SpsG
MFISYAWESVYDENFEILVSDHYSLEEEELYKLKEKISRYIHNKWVDEKISEGWRYGINNNSNQKTSPYLRNWDSLPEDFRKILELDAKKAVDFSKKYL